LTKRATVIELSRQQNIPGRWDRPKSRAVAEEAARPFLHWKEESMIIKRFHATFAKLPTGEVVVVLTIDPKKRSMMTGTRRPETGNFVGAARLKTQRVFVDSVVFQHGVVRADWTERLSDKEPYWYDPWEYNEDACAWRSFDTYYEGWDWEDKDARVYPVDTLPWREDSLSAG